LTVEKSETPQLLADYGVKNRKGSSYFTFLRDPMTLAHSIKRYWWIKNGYFAFSRNQVLQDSLSGPELKRNFFRNWMNSDFLSGSLKNAQQMLACEGVCATIFFWMSMDKELRENYRPIAFYQPFLGTGTVREVREIVSPEENILLKMVFAKYMLFRDYAASQKPVYRPVMADFIKKYMTLFPEDSGSAVLHFCMATHLTSCWKEGREAYAQTALAVSLIPIETASASSAFQALGKSVQEKMNAVRKESGGLFSEIGEPLWIENDLFQVAILGSEEKQPLSINLNAAEEFELMTIPGVTVSLAGKFVQERDRNGNFTDLAQIEGLGIFLPAQVMELKRMRKRFESAAGETGKVVGMR
jgi:DNA uptake protein ComE-like DNA-binding protein